VSEIIFVSILLALALGFGTEIGRLTGQDEACKSVNAEWVKDKCMKVTREQVK
jgi:hypothetical protein